MAPLTNEPDAIRVVLNMARRKAYYSLVSDIIAYMRSQLEPHHHHSPESTPPSSSSSSTHKQNPPPPYSESADAPLFASRTNSSNNNRPQRQSYDLQQSESPHSSHEVSPPQPPRPAQRHAPTSPALVRLRKAALAHFDAWRAATMGKLKEVVAKNDDQTVVEARRKRAEALKARARDVPGEGEDLLSFGESSNSINSNTPSTTNTSSASSSGTRSRAEDDDKARTTAFQALYHQIPTRLTTIPLADRKEVLSATLILLLSFGNYSAHSRTLICHLGSALEIPPTFLDAEETEIATTMVGAAQKADADMKKQNGMSAETEAQKRREQGQTGRFWKVGLASVAGAALIGVTGGLAAPAVAGVIGGLMGSVGLGGLASFLGIFWMNGALVGALFGAFGGKMTGEAVDRYAREVEDFRFLPLKAEWGEGNGSGWSRDGPEARRLRITIGINGWLEEEADVSRPWRVLGDETEVFALRYEMGSLMALGRRLRELVASKAWGAVRAEILRRTVLVSLQGALWPLFLLNSAAGIDNPFSLARNRSEKAGRILADALINRVQGERPVTLVGYSLGARVVYACLRELAERKAFGLVDTAVLVGAPVPSNAGHWQMMRAVVAGRLVNVYSENDYILAFLYRSTSLQLGIAGLQPIDAEVNGVENLDLSAEVQGHLRYPELLSQILSRCGFPGLRGGAEVIEREVEALREIQLRDSDFAEMGNLIDVEEPVRASRDGLEVMGNKKFDPTVKDLKELKSEAIVRTARRMGPEKEDADAPSAGIPSSAITKPVTSSMTNLHESLPPLQTRFGDAERSASTSHIPQDLSSSYSGVGRDDDYDYDDDADEYGGSIEMMDNDGDGDLTTVEPLRIDD
ncbi:Uu.00g031710.m01.CDS01 [Anthostomella pinea]|uniref:Uu.00g031710.m01.CDS01 n=1 Tax=Anthostomella pinea TaxID=933095 RepID=A0AAI8V3N6_9PEZI|nr:Uu.00g031710.m01.CDS01 [Anthostomella pinea]